MYASIIVTLLLSGVMLRVGDRVLSRFGQTGIRVTTRIMGLMLAAVAVQFVITGVREALAPVIADPSLRRGLLKGVTAPARHVPSRVTVS